MKIPSTCILRLSTFFIVYFGELTRRDSSAATKMSTRDTFILLQPQWLHPSLSKLWHQGVHFTLYWRSADANGNATAHMHLFITWSCIYISQEMSVSLFERWFPRGVSHRNKQSRQQWGCSGPIWQPGGSFMSPVRREMASWATSTRPHWSCCQSSSRTTTAAYLDRESCEDGSVCRCVWGTHTHTHTHTHTPLWVMRSSVQVWRKTSEAESTSEKTHRAETHRGGSVRTWEGNKRGRRSAQWRFLMFSSHINTNQSIRNKALMETLHCTSLQISWLEGGNH